MLGRSLEGRPNRHEVLAGPGTGPFKCLGPPRLTAVMSHTNTDSTRTRTGSTAEPSGNGKREGTPVVRKAASPLGMQATGGKEWSHLNG
ncbi:hypothetical protein VTK56DRAFT_7793 [Thermocarpiscus australiensis]